jgi:hypothetical protein
MAKADTKPIKRPKRTDPEQFERFIAAARNRSIDESLEDFAYPSAKEKPRRAGAIAGFSDGEPLKRSGNRSPST